MSKRIEVSVVAYQHGELWVAQCVEYDIAAFAKHIRDLPRAFERAVAANVCANVDLGRQALEGIPRAPAEFREMFERSEIGLKHRPAGDARRPASRLPVRIRDVRLAEAAA